MTPVAPLIAEVAHEINRRLRTTLGEPDQPSWQQAGDWTRESKIWQVEQVMDGASHEGFHRAWCERMSRQGWRYGAVDSFALKLSSTMVDFTALGTNQVIKDEVFLTLVRELGPKLLGIQDRMARLVQRVPSATLMEFIDEERRGPRE